MSLILGLIILGGIGLVLNKRDRLGRKWSGGLILLGGISLVALGVYDLNLIKTQNQHPTTVSIAELEQAIPSNPNLIVTGGQPMLDDEIVRSYQIRRRRYGGGSKVAGSEVYFIPIQDTSLAAYSSFTPPLLVLIKESQLNAIKDFDSIHGFRIAHWNLASEARDLLIEKYGQEAFKKMIILEHEKTSIGSIANIRLAIGFGKLVCGAASIIGVVMVLVTPFLEHKD